MPGYPVCRSVRLPGYDYASPGAYFVTVCTHRRACTVGIVDKGQVVLSPLGESVVAAWTALPVHFPGVVLDAFVVMPNHLHGIVIIMDPAAVNVAGISVAGVGAKHPAIADASPLHVPHRALGTTSGSIPALIQNAKSVSARRVNQLRGTPGALVWQRGYFEHIVRSHDELDRLRTYIEQNPLRWELDRENPARP
jgi:putative transposase